MTAQATPQRIVFFARQNQGFRVVGEKWVINGINTLPVATLPYLPAHAHAHAPTHPRDKGGMPLGSDGLYREDHKVAITRWKYSGRVYICGCFIHNLFLPNY
jgi:hypothetical protein